MLTTLFLISTLIHLSVDAQQITSKDCKCTVRAFPRIVGGEEAGRIPWQISLARYNQHTCGGTILNHNYVMTAAHCVVDLNSMQLVPSDTLTVRVGIHKLNDPTIGSKTYAVRRIIVHSRYFEAGRNTAGPGDIALLEIDGSIPFDQNVQPACLPEHFEDYDDKVGSLLASGWGSITRTISTPSGQLGNAHISNFLKEADFNYLSLNSPNLVNLLGINPSSVSPSCAYNHLLCIRPVSQGDSVCNGDSGGPIMHVKDGIASVVGVASFVLGVSTSGGYTVYCTGDGAYSRVSSYLTFIGNHIGKDNYCRY